MSSSSFSLKWILKEWGWNKTLFALSLFLLSLAYLGVLLNLSYQSSTDRFIEEQSRFILGGDLVLSSRSAPISEDEFQQIKAKIEQAAEETLEPAQVIEFLANVRTEASATMAEVYAISPNFPLVGELLTDSKEPLRWENSNETPAIYADNEIAKILELKEGQKVKIGTKEFIFLGSILENSNLSRGSSVIAPRVYIAYPMAKETGLLSFGSQVDYDYYFTLSDPARAKSIAENLEPQGESRPWSARSASDSLNRLERTLDFIGKYLSWLSLLMILLGFITGFYLSQVHLRKASPRIAILVQLGLSPKRAQWIYGLQITFEQLLSFGFAVLALQFLTYFYIQPAALKLPIPLDFRMDAFSLLGGFSLSLLMSFLFLFPYLLRLPRLKLKPLLDQSTPFLPEEKNFRNWLPYAFILISFYALTGVFLQDYRLSLAWLGFMLLSLAFPVLIFPLLFRKGGENLKNIWIKIPFLQLSRARFASSLLFISLCQILFVLSLLPQLHRGIESQLSQTANEKIPSFFAINIQEEDIEGIQSFFETHTAELKYLSPMILGRLMKKNEEPVTDERFLTRPLRLSYRAHQLSSEEVIEGLYELPPAKPGQEVGALSVEEEYAERHDLNLGDVLEFDIGGLDIKGEIQQIRRIQWESFQPNFFMQFQGGFIDDFPKTWIGVVYDVPEEQRLNVLQAALNQFSSMSLIDLTQTLNKLAEITRTLTPPIQGAAYVQTGLTLFILFFLVLYHQSSRTEELALFQLLGATSVKVRLMMTLENLILSGVAGMIAIGLALLFAKWLLYFVFEVNVSLDWVTPIYALFVSLSTIALVTWFTTAKIQATRSSKPHF